MAFFSNRRQQEQTDDDRETPARVIPTPPVGFETVLGANSALEGTLTSTGNVRLDGTFTGTLNITGNVLIGETAKINAHVDARNISIAGAVRGNVTGNKVQILRTGRIWGDISATALTTEEGAFIDGRITMKGHAANQQQALPSAAAPASAAADTVDAADATQSAPPTPKSDAPSAVRGTPDAIIDSELLERDATITTPLNPLQPHED